MIISLTEAVIALPAHIVHGLKNKQKRISKKKIRIKKTKEPFFNKIRQGFAFSMEGLLTWRYALISFYAVVLIITGWYAFSHMKLVLFPTLGAEEFAIYLETPAGTSLKKTSDLVERVEKIIDEIPGKYMDSYMTLIGNQEGLFNQNNIASIRVNLTPFSKRDKTVLDVTEELRIKIQKVQGFTKTIFDVSDTGPNPERPVSFHIVGNNNTVRKKLGNDVFDFLKQIEGIVDLERSDKEGKEQIEVIPKHQNLARYGMDFETITQQLRGIYDGMIVTKVHYDDELVDFRIRYPEKYRKNTSKLLNLSFPNIDGRLVVLRNFAYLKKSFSPAVYNHFDGERCITIQSRVSDENISSSQIPQLLDKNFNLYDNYPGMMFVIEGDAKKQEESVGQITRAFILAILGIYFLLVLLFSSMSQPLLVLIAIPFGLSGVIITFIIHSLSFSFLALLGIIGLTGVVVNDSIVMVDHLNNIIRSNQKEDLKTLIARGASERLRAVLLTTITTAAGLLPLAYGIGGSDPMIAPMVLAMGWGLLFATPLTLVLVPCLYLVRNDIGNIFKKIFQKNIS